eukprot:CAMPEP_0168619030 /NCGR_PEP_ID=MMETSP0449_2-20121227/6387_1 /TAXON_ID=1082188 /ORGANISM="Strombidium rassoulzadegani, Strain ras09" /LENGTH=238 /DNA_ID=CAMNT_0008659943 /DNA_START=231 /DNA_END=948 /DNA_ORIENTATION=-
MVGVGGEGRHVEDLGYLDGGAELFPAHGGVVEALEVDDEDFRVAVDGHVLLHVVDGLALGALVAALLEGLLGYVIIEALLHVYVARYSDGVARDGHREVHEAVEGEALVAALACSRTTGPRTGPLLLSCRARGSSSPKSRTARRASSSRSLSPGTWASTPPVQLIVHAVEEEAQELLGVLLPVARELLGHAADLGLEVLRRDLALAAAGLEEEVLVGEREGLFAHLARALEVFEQILG